jgi:two-component system, NtrC family, response regulator
MACGAGALARLVGCCPAIESLRCEIRKIGPSDSRVHVFGETGTGKERVARALHELSPRASRPFVPLNAAGIGDELLPSELFGCAKGAYTGAAVTRDGYIAAAEGGTLFIDEVAELTPLAQARLLRFLQEGEYQRLGETVVRKANVRVVSATNVDLPRRVAEGRFREDLWFRLKVHCLVVPPLRERGSDVLLLARHFLAAEARTAGVEMPRLSSEAEEALLAYAWRGNVRELEHEMQRLVVRAPGTEVSREDLSADIGTAPRPGGTLKAALQRAESEILVSMLEKHEGRQARAAAELGITRQALWAKLRRLGVWPSEPV